MARRRHTGWGNGVQRANPPSVLLFNFDVGSPSLKLEHWDMLRSWVVPYLRKGHSISIVGLASRTGSTAYNQKLSQDRADNTLRFLKSEVREGFNARSVIGFGELKAAAEGERDNTEDPRFRSVLILSAPGPTPPPPPPKIDLEKLVPKAFKHEGFSLDAGQVNDLVSGMVGLIENIAPELPELAENILGTADIATAVIGAIIGMPMLWLGVSEQSEANGYKQGYWEGMEDMARRYSNEELKKKPVLQWPPLEEPKARPIVGYSGSTTERDWMEGKEKGCKLAFVVVSQFERAKPGAGRVLLFVLWYQYGDTLGESIKRAIISKTGNVWPKIDF
jgi:hypothetical protein